MNWETFFDQWSAQLARLRFSPPVQHVYNPLEYARAPNLQYFNSWAQKPCRILFLGMNPGPFGMVQTGIPFGEVDAVRNYLRIDAPVLHPRLEHPRRPVLGFDCTRSEVSGRRLWGWIRKRHPDPASFFRDHFVANYCPLAFMEISGKNLTPDKLPKHEVHQLFDICDRALVQLVDKLEVQWVIGIGAFAEKRARLALGHLPLNVASVVHPSPASPMANKGWEPLVETRLRELDLL